MNTYSTQKSIMQLNCALSSSIMLPSSRYQRSNDVELGFSADIR